jgi:hypothetical protein
MPLLTMLVSQALKIMELATSVAMLLNIRLAAMVKRELHLQNVIAKSDNTSWLMYALTKTASLEPKHPCMAPRKVNSMAHARMFQFKLHTLHHLAG